MESLGLDWKILLAQIINFGILLFVLKKLLYKPLLKAIDDRNKKVNDAVVNSAKIEERLKKIEDQEKVILDKARDKAKTEREELIAIAFGEKEKIIEDAKAGAQREVEKGIESLHSAQKEAVAQMTEDYLEKIAEKLSKRFEGVTKKGNYPLLKSLTKNG